MNSLPPDRRGVGAGMATTFQNSALVLSIGVSFSLMILGLAASLPGTMQHGLVAQGVSPRGRPPHLAAAAGRPAVGSFLGYNPMHELLGPSLQHLSNAQAAHLTGREFFPALISQSFSDGLHEAFDFAIACCLVAAAASWFRGGRYVHGMEAAESRAVEAGDGELVLADAGD